MPLTNCSLLKMFSIFWNFLPRKFSLLDQNTSQVHDSTIAVKYIYSNRPTYFRHFLSKTIYELSSHLTWGNNSVTYNDWIFFTTSDLTSEGKQHLKTFNLSTATINSYIKYISTPICYYMCCYCPSWLLLLIAEHRPDNRIKELG